MKIIKLNTTIQKLIRDGCCIEQIHESGKAFVAIKNRHDSTRMWIKTYENETLLYLYSKKKSIQLLSGGPGGFSWLKSSNFKTVYFFRLSTNMQSSWLLENDHILDCKVLNEGEIIYYKHAEAVDDGSQYGLVYCRGNDMFWKTISEQSTVKYLNDSFSKYQFINKSNNFLLVNTPNESSAFLLTQENIADVFGSNCFLTPNSVAITHNHQRICLRDDDFLLIYDLSNKQNTIFKVSPPEIQASNENDDTIKHFLFSPCDQYLLVFFLNHLCIYDTHDTSCVTMELPQQFKTLHQLTSPTRLIFHSKADKLYQLAIENNKSILFTKIDSPLYQFLCN